MLFAAVGCVGAKLATYRTEAHPPSHLFAFVQSQTKRSIPLPLNMKLQPGDAELRFV